jgi:hypothetical protein
MLRLLAPAVPVSSGRTVTVRARLDEMPGTGAWGSWDWDDGQRDDARLTGRDLVLPRRAHRYSAPGVYRVKVAVGEADAPDPQLAIRYVTVRRDADIAASGWIRDAASATAVPFGFLVTTSVDGQGETVILRCLIDGDEVLGGDLGWLFSGEPGSLHFGGTARVGDRSGEHPFRVDIRESPGQSGRTGQHMVVSLYHPGSVPGRDSPLRRVSGPIRPGRADVRGYAPKG